MIGSVYKDFEFSHNDQIISGLSFYFYGHSGHNFKRSNLPLFKS